MSDKFAKTMEQIIALIKEAGYEPYAQLIGYLETGKDSYITRSGGARYIVSELDKGQIYRYIEENRTEIK